MNFLCISKLLTQKHMNAELFWIFTKKRC